MFFNRSTRRPSPAPRPVRRRLELECLEDRTVPTGIVALSGTWQGQYSVSVLGGPGQNQNNSLAATALTSISSRVWAAAATRLSSASMSRQTAGRSKIAVVIR